MYVVNKFYILLGVLIAEPPYNLFSMQKNCVLFH